MPSLETILTHPRAFALTTASPVQRAMCRVIDGSRLGELASDPTVIQTFGGVEAIQAIEAAGRPTEFYLVGAIRSGKSLIMAAVALHTALTIKPPPQIKRYEPMRVSVVSLDKDKAGAIMDHLMGALTREGGALNRYLMKNPKPSTERLWIRRDDGRQVEIVIAAGRKGGASLVSRWTIAAIFDEACRMQGTEDGVINFDDSRLAVIARLRLIGGQLLAVSSPWAARGPIYDAVEESFGKPTKDLIIMRATGPQICPFNWTPEACEAERLAPHSSYQTDVLGEFVDPDQGWLTAMEVRVATRPTPEMTDYDQLCDYVAAMDPGISGNAWSLVVAGKRQDVTDSSKDKYFVAGCWEWQGTSGAPLKAREVFADIAPILREYKLHEVYSDRFAGSLIAEHGDMQGVTVQVSRDTTEQTAKNHADFRTLLLDSKLELAPIKQLGVDLLSKRLKRMPNGATKYDAPVTKDGRHADMADAAVLAVARLRGGPTWVSAMDRLRKRGGHI